MTLINQNKLNVKNQVLEYLDLILGKFDEGFEVEIKEESDGFTFDIKTCFSEEFLENKAERLSDLQHLVRLMVHSKNPGDKTHFSIDVDGYRQKRHDYICQKIPELVSQKVIRGGSSIVITGLNSFERYTIHKLLSEVKGVQSFGVGLRENRRLVIMSSSEIGTTGIEAAEIFNVDNL